MGSIFFIHLLSILLLLTISQRGRLKSIFNHCVHFYFCFYRFFLCQLTEELQNVRESESRYKQQHTEAQKREKMLIRRLAAKEQELQEYVVGF